MKAAILVGVGCPLEVVDLAEPALEVGQVRVALECSGICGKQIDEITGKREDPYLPHLLGHEGVGKVVEVGPGVRKVAPGDRVVLHWMKGSGIDSAPPRYARDGQVVSAGWVTTFSDRTIASENRVTKIARDMPREAAALMGCAVTTGIGIVLNDAQLSAGRSLVVFGAGGVGLNVVQGATLVSGRPIVAVDLVDAKLERARQFGATHGVNAGAPDLERRLRAIPGDGGFDVAVDTTGARAAIEMAYAVTAKTGTTVLAGVPDERTRITIDPFPLNGGRRLIGSHGGGTRPDVDIPRYAALYRAGILRLDDLVTHRFPLERVNEAIEVVRTGAAGRCVLTMS